MNNAINNKYIVNPSDSVNPANSRPVENIYIVQPINKSTVQVEKKGIQLKDVFIPSFAVVIGGVSGGIINKKRQSAMLDVTIKNIDKTAQQIRNFTSSPKYFENNVVQRATTKPYKHLMSIIEKMKQVNEKPKLEIPNCLMFISKNDSRAKKAIEAFKNIARQNYIEVDGWDESVNLLNVLDDAKKNFNSTGKWNLIYVKDMDKLINPSEVDFDCIEGMKSIMCCTADEYCSTLLFQTKDWRNLDDIAIETNRVLHSFDVDNMEHFEEFCSLYAKHNEQVELAQKLLNNKKQIPLKGIGIGILVMLAITTVGYLIKNYIHKGDKNESSK